MRAPRLFGGKKKGGKPTASSQEGVLKGKQKAGTVYFSMKKRKRGGMTMPFTCSYQKERG